MKNTTLSHCSWCTANPFSTLSIFLNQFMKNEPVYCWASHSLPFIATPSQHLLSSNILWGQKRILLMYSINCIIFFVLMFSVNSLPPSAVCEHWNKSYHLGNMLLAFFFAWYSLPRQAWGRLLKEWVPSDWHSGHLSSNMQKTPVCFLAPQVLWLVANKISVLQDTVEKNV